MAPASYVSLGQAMFSVENFSVDAATLFLGGENDFHAATPDATVFFAATVGWPSFLVADSPVAATLFLGGEDDVVAAMPAAFAFVAALMGWPSFFAVQSPAVFAALSGGMLCYAALSGFLRRLRAVAAIFWDACRGVAQSGLGPVIVASRGCLQSCPGGFAALLPEPPCTMVDCRHPGGGSFAGVWTSTSSCTSCLSMGFRRGFVMAECHTWGRKCSGSSGRKRV